MEKKNYEVEIYSDTNSYWKIKIYDHVVDFSSLAKSCMNNNGIYSTWGNQKQFHVIIYEIHLVNHEIKRRHVWSGKVAVPHKPLTEVAYNVLLEQEIKNLPERFQNIVKSVFHEINDSFENKLLQVHELVSQIHIALDEFQHSIQKDTYPKEQNLRMNLR